jgi:hypothetical protein
MAIGVYFPPSAMTGAQYDECIKLLRKAGAGHPTGRLYHACFGEATGLSVFDVWSSQSAFERFGKTLMPIMQQLGINAGPPQIVPVHNTITRPKAAGGAKPRAKKKAKKKAKRKAKR